MRRLQKIAITIAVISLLVIAMSLIASSWLRPNQSTPANKLLSSQSQKKNFPADYTVAAWIWRYPTNFAPEAQQMVDFANTQGINTLYVYIDEYIDIYEMPESEEKQSKLTSYMDSIKKIISLAKQKNISVHALSGDTSFSYDSHSYIPSIILDHVLEFNAQNPESAFEGVQFDIEFYEDSRFFSSTKEYTQEYLKLVKDLAAKTKGHNLELGFVIPFWFDEANQYFDSPIIDDVVESISSTDKPYLVLMSYRNQIEGDGGVLEISKKELEQTQESNVKIIIAQELVENKEIKITHFGKSRSQIQQELLKIIEGAKSYKNFAGISIHDLQAYMNAL